MKNLVVEYAILNSDGTCVNRCLWDGVSDWQPPEGCTVLPDPDNAYRIVQEPRPEPEPEPESDPDFDVLANLTPMQKAAFLALIKKL